MATLPPAHRKVAVGRFVVVTGFENRLADWAALNGADPVFGGS